MEFKLLRSFKVVEMKKMNAELSKKAINFYILGLLVLSAVIHLWGMRQDLPYLANIDEPIFVSKAVNMVATGDLNPHWFGNPGSTVIYPLALIYKIAYGFKNPRYFFHRVKDLKLNFHESDAHFYYIGRGLTIFYNVFSLSFIVLIGSRLLNPYVGLFGGGFYIFCTTALAHAQVVRTDSAAVFFGMASLWLCLKVYDEDKLIDHIWAGIAIGLAIASRYFMASLIPVLLCVNILHLSKKWKNKQLEVKSWLPSVLGLLMIPTAFLIVTPYFILDFSTALKNLLTESRHVHAGFDGLTPAGNLKWYALNVIPSNLGIMQIIAMGIGVLFTFVNKNIKGILLLIYCLIFMLGISLSGLHWARWIIPVLPIFNIFAALAVIGIAGWITGFQMPFSNNKYLIAVLLFIVLSVQPAIGMIKQNTMNSKYSTNVTAREWVYQSIPRGAQIIHEWFTAPLYGNDYKEHEVSKLSDSSLSEYLNQGYEYFMASEWIYSPFFAEPDRFRKEMEFYNLLFSKGVLLKEIIPQKGQNGPKVRIYYLKKGDI